MKKIYVLKIFLKRISAFFAAISFIVLFKPLAIALTPLILIYIWNKRTIIKNIKIKPLYLAIFIFFIFVFIGILPQIRKNVSISKTNSLINIRDFFLKDSTRIEIKERILERVASYYSANDDDENRDLFNLNFKTDNNNYKRVIRLNPKLDLPSYLSSTSCHNFLSNGLHKIIERDGIDDFEFINLINRYEIMKDICKNESVDYDIFQQILNKITLNNETLASSKENRKKVFEKEIKLLRHRIIPFEDFSIRENLKQNTSKFYIFDNTFIFQIKRDKLTPEDFNYCFDKILSLFATIASNDEMGGFAPWLNQWHDIFRIIVIMEPFSDNSELNELTPIKWSKSTLTFKDSNTKTSRSKMCFMQRDTKGVYFNAL